MVSENFLQVDQNLKKMNQKIKFKVFFIFISILEYLFISYCHFHYNKSVKMLTGKVARKVPFQG